MVLVCNDSQSLTPRTLGALGDVLRMKGLTAGLSSWFMLNRGCYLFLHPSPVPLLTGPIIAEPDARRLIWAEACINGELG